MTIEKTFNKEALQHAHDFLENSQRDFIRIVVNKICKMPELICSAPSQTPHPSGVGTCSIFSTTVDVCEMHVDLYIYADCKSDNREKTLLAIKIDCADMFISKRYIQLYNSKELKVVWKENTVKSIIVKS